MTRLNNVTVCEGRFRGELFELYVNIDNGKALVILPMTGERFEGSNAGEALTKLNQHFDSLQGRAA